MHESAKLSTITHEIKAPTRVRVCLCVCALLHAATCYQLSLHCVEGQLMKLAATWDGVWDANLAPAR